MQGVSQKIGCTVKDSIVHAAPFSLLRHRQPRANCFLLLDNRNSAWIVLWRHDSRADLA